MIPISRRAFSIVFATFLLIGGGAVVSAENEKPIQPLIHLVFGSAGGDGTDRVTEARHLLHAAVESRFVSEQRYHVVRKETDLEPEPFLESNSDIATGIVVFVRLSARRDGSDRVEYDVWNGNAFTFSREEELPVGRNRFVTVDRIASELSGAVEELFPGFGRIAFLNTGANENFYVWVNERFLGANPAFVELPNG